VELEYVVRFSAGAGYMGSSTLSFTINSD